MHWLRQFLDNIEPHFGDDAKLKKLEPIFEAIDTILYTTDERTKSGPHIRDSVDIKRVMILVVISLLLDQEHLRFYCSYFLLNLSCFFVAFMTTALVVMFITYNNSIKAAIF